MARGFVKDGTGRWFSWFSPSTTSRSTANWVAETAVHRRFLVRPTRDGLPFILRWQKNKQTDKQNKGQTRNRWAISLLFSRFFCLYRENHLKAKKKGKRKRKRTKRNRARRQTCRNSVKSQWDALSPRRLTNVTEIFLLNTVKLGNIGRCLARAKLSKTQENPVKPSEIR